MESGFDPLKIKVRENPAWVALGGEVPSLTMASHRHLDMGCISLSSYDIPELVVPIRISLIEGCC
jgi:hypothetical protein